MAKPSLTFLQFLEGTILVGVVIFLIIAARNIIIKLLQERRERAEREGKSLLNEEGTKKLENDLLQAKSDLPALVEVEEITDIAEHASDFGPVEEITLGSVPSAEETPDNKGVVEVKITAEKNNAKTPSKEEATRSSILERRYHTIFYINPAPIMIINHKQKVVELNRKMQSFVQKDKKSLMGAELKELIYQEDHALLRGLTPEKLVKKPTNFSIDVRLLPIADSPFWVKVFPQVIPYESTTRPHILLLFQDIRDAKTLAERVAFHSQYDELTLLHNREGLETYLAQTLDITSDKYGQVALIYIDIDQMKVVNDTCGHIAGDKLLQQLVAVIGEAASDCHFFARIGGDEFALVKTNSSEDEAKALAESIRSAAEDLNFEWEGQRYRQSLSVGVALSSHELDSVVDLIGAADSSCYAAKEQGKNRVMMYTGGLDTQTMNHRDMQWVSRLQKAIQDGAFELYFQPIERLKKGDKRHVHYELLIRYVDDKGQHILPQHFLPAVEKFGLSEQVDLWVLTTALDYLDRHPEHTKILDCCSINLTSQSIANPRIRSAILQVVKSYSFPLNKVCFEITESSAIKNLEDAQDFVNELKKLGCHLALDDFGTGFSSFGYLKHLEVDYIKIDGSFVRDITSDRFDRAMVSAINNIGKEMNISIIAEYAGNANILKLLRHLEVDYAQGNAIAYPLPIYTLESYYQE